MTSFKHDNSIKSKCQLEALVFLEALFQQIIDLKNLQINFFSENSDSTLSDKNTRNTQNLMKKVYAWKIHLSTEKYYTTEEPIIYNSVYIRLSFG